MTTVEVDYSCGEILHKERCVSAPISSSEILAGEGKGIRLYVNLYGIIILVLQY